MRWNGVGAKTRCLMGRYNTLGHRNGRIGRRRSMVSSGCGLPETMLEEIVGLTATLESVGVGLAGGG